MALGLGLRSCINCARVVGTGIILSPIWNHFALSPSKATAAIIEQVAAVMNWAFGHARLLLLRDKLRRTTGPSRTGAMFVYVAQTGFRYQELMACVAPLCIDILADVIRVGLRYQEYSTADSLMKGTRRNKIHPTRPSRQQSLKQQHCCHEAKLIAFGGKCVKAPSALARQLITRCLPAAQRFTLLALLEKKLTRACKVQAQINSPQHKTQTELTQVSLQAKDKRRAFITDKIRRVYTRSSTWTTALRTNNTQKKIKCTVSQRPIPFYALFCPSSWATELKILSSRIGRESILYKIYDTDKKNLLISELNPKSDVLDCLAIGTK
ncbi:hypothetical protein J6590_013434 [Homalodisca vitripennis]|nr:hypothetical protein J6590_013434 [Homalodisca vitripennis]